MSNFDFRLRYQVREDTPHGILFKYLQSKETEFDTRQMVLWSLSAFWQTQAFQWSGGYSEDRLQAIARLSIYELRQQIKYLACAFGLEKELLEAGGSYPMQHNSVKMDSVTPEQLMATRSQGDGFDKDEMSESSPQAPELVHHSDDELFNQMIRG